ncbi:alpha/beta hydrolase [Hymenobacter oligotrophus]|uniref:Alpha/beta hydrolase n=1 Tax=Hymenobacter oligotrophus TaxID=2319843 RepID=A0A3B7RPR7_9BACT|nr:alpha/beta hydrolase [Hymenobacter oligotrophus]AYA36187.1 alpha/beta hydrolase [Hymenobacter oligotrophus]
MILRFIYLLLSGLLLLLSPVRAADNPTPPRSLDGLWKGPLKVPGGQLEVIFRLVKLTGGQYFATLDVPLQKVSHMAVHVDVRNDTVVFFAEEAASRFSGRLSPDGQQLTGQWHQPSYEVPMLLRYAPPATAPGGKVRLTPPYREEEVAFANAGAAVRLGGMLTVPPGPGPFPAVVLVPDAGPLDRDATVGEYRPMGALADYLTRRGIAVLRCDARGVASSEGTPNPTLAERVADVEAALNYLRTRREVDFARLGVLGHGEGGNVALLSATRALGPAFVVALAAAGLPGQEMAVAQQKRLLQSIGLEAAQVATVVQRQQLMLDVIRQTPDNQQAQAMVVNMLRQSNTALEPAAAQAAAAELTSPRYRFLLGFDPAPLLVAVKCPVLLLNGTADVSVDAETNLAALSKGLRGNHAVTVKKLPGVNHGFQSDPAEWPIVSGERRPVFSPVAQEQIRAWIIALQRK